MLYCCMLSDISYLKRRNILQKFYFRKVLVGKYMILKCVQCDSTLLSYGLSMNSSVTPNFFLKFGVEKIHESKITQCIY